MLKKIVLALVFLGLVVAVSYYRAVTQKERTTAAYERGQEESAHQVEEYADRLDSLAYSVERQEREAAKSLWRRELAYRKGYDSLGKLIELKEGEIAPPRTGVEQSQPPNETTKVVEDTIKRKPLKHEQILSYYNKRYRTLPEDLSPYEKRVAVAEIRGETARKFSISLRELDKIRVDNKLDY